MGALTYTGAITPGNNEDFGEVQTNFGNITTWANANVSDDNLSADFSYYTNWKTIMTAQGYLGDSAFSTVGQPLGGSAAGTLLGATSIGLQVEAASVAVNVPTVYWDADDYTATGLVPQLRLRATVARNAIDPQGAPTAPAVVVMAGVAGVTLALGADDMRVFDQSILRMLTFLPDTLASSSVVTKVSTPFDSPSDGTLLVDVQRSSADVGSGSVLLINAEIQRRWVAS